MEFVSISSCVVVKERFLSNRCMFKQHTQADMQHTFKKPNFEIHSTRAAQGCEATKPANGQGKGLASEVAASKVVTPSFIDLRRIVRLAQLLEHLGLSRSTVYLRLNPKSKYHDPKFPKPIRLGAKAVGWLMADISAYIDYLQEGKASA